MFNMPLLMVILSLVYPIVAPFDIILETLKIFLTAWDTYRTSLDLTVSPTCSFIFTVNLRSHFNFCPFFNVTSILHSSILVMFYSCMWYEMTHHCIPTGLQGLLPCHFTRLVYRMCPVQRVCRRHLLSSSSWTNNQPPYIIFSKVVTFSAEVGFSVIIIFLFPLFSPLHKYDALLSYLPLLLHVPLKNLLLCCFLSPVFSARTFYSGSCFSCFLFLPNYFFQNQLISFLRSLYSIFYMLILQETLTGLNYSVRTPKTCALILSSSLSYFALIFFNLKFKLNISLRHMPGSWLVSLILQLFHLLAMIFLQDSCTFALHCLTKPKCIYANMIRSKHQALLFPSWIYNCSKSSSAYY